MARIAFFAFDIAEAAQLRRIESVRSLGHAVSSVSFRRANMSGKAALSWPDLPLGPSSNNRYVLRLIRLLRALFILWRNRAVLNDGDVWIARNLDMLALAVAMRRLTAQPQVRVVYECLDIHGLFTRTDAIGALMRWSERKLLSQCDLLILSSPGFLDAYFRPVQQVKTPVALLENKLWTEGEPPARPASPRTPSRDGPFVLGWVGSLRCPQSLAILTNTAKRLGDEIEIRCSGAVHRHALPEFDAILASHANITYSGPYRYPDDLGAIYTACDAVWAQDLWQTGANSDWLLPNRIYEASYYGCPSIALSRTETGRRIARDDLGFTVAEATSEALVDLIQGLSPEKVTAASASLLARPASDFRLTASELSQVLEPVLNDRTDMIKDAPAASLVSTG